MDEFRESSENQNIITFRNLLDEENEFENSFGIPTHAFWTTLVCVMIFTVISKAFGEKEKTKMLSKNEVHYLCADVPCRETAIYCL